MNSGALTTAALSSGVFITRELCEASAAQSSFNLLDLDFGDGSRWRATHAAWRAGLQASPERPRFLHYVALAPAMPTGFQRQTFDNGQVRLTLCGGPLTYALKELRFEAAWVVLPLGIRAANTAKAANVAHVAQDVVATFEWDVWAIKLLARCCRRGTRLQIEFGSSSTSPVAVPGLDALSTLFRSQGFEWDITNSQGIYNPRWEPKNRQSTPQAPLQGPLSESLPLPVGNTRCIVIGAGLAGASSAYALARRGWQVEVIDAHPHPAMGASSLPAGLLAAHTSADDSPRSRLSRAGEQLTLEQCHALLVEGQDWQASGVLTLKPGAAPKRHAGAAWIKPQTLVDAWLAAPGIRFTGGLAVAALRRVSALPPAQTSGLQPGQPSGRLTGEPAGELAQAHPSEIQPGLWEVLDGAGRVLASAPLVVVAAAGGSTALLQASLGAGIAPFTPLTEVPGQVSWGAQQAGDTACMPLGPVNGLGSFLPNLPGLNGSAGLPSGPSLTTLDDSHNPQTPGHASTLAWLVAATFEDATQPLDETTAHAQNLARLQQLLPGTAAHLQARFDAGDIKAWRGSRCTTPNRLPLVKSLAPGLWLNTGYGSRGLTWSVLCAELLAARLHGEPWPIEASLARGLD